MSVEQFPRSEERLNAATHAFGAVLGAVGLVFLVLQANEFGHSGSMLAVTIYGVSLILLYLSSALQHAAMQSKCKQILLAADHCGIYFLIAGTYTPFCLLLPLAKIEELLTLVWGLALTGILIQLVAFIAGKSDLYERFAFVFYLALGWIPLLWAGDDIYRNLSQAGLILLFAGGVTYSIGVIFYLWERLPYSHAVWHLFVVAASAFHFISIYNHVIPKVS